MEFPPGCATDSDRAEYALGEVAKLMDTHHNRAAEYRSGTLTLVEFKEWEKKIWKPKDKHARHVADLYLKTLRLKGVPNEDPESQEAQDRQSQLESLKAKAKDNNKFKANLDAKGFNNLAAPWDKGMNKMYEALQIRAEKIAKGEVPPAAIGG